PTGCGQGTPTSGEHGWSVLQTKALGQWFLQRPRRRGTVWVPPQPTGVLVAALARHLPRYLLHVAPGELAERADHRSGHNRVQQAELPASAPDRKTIFPPSCLHDRTSPGQQPW